MQNALRLRFSNFHQKPTLGNKGKPYMSDWNNATMIKPFFESAQCRAFGYRTNYLVTSTGNYKVRTDTVKGVIWQELTPEDFAKNYMV